MYHFITITPALSSDELEVVKLLNQNFQYTTPENIALLQRFSSFSSLLPLRENITLLKQYGNLALPTRLENIRYENYRIEGEGYMGIHIFKLIHTFSSLGKIRQLLRLNTQVHRFSRVIASEYSDEAFIIDNEYIYSAVLQHTGYYKAKDDIGELYLKNFIANISAKILEDKLHDELSMKKETASTKI